MKTLREARRGKLTLRLVEAKEGYSGGVLADKGGRVALIPGDNADEVWRRLEEEAAKADRSYVGFEGARIRFLHFFPGGFHGARYASEERDYKVNAKAGLDASVPLAEAADGTGFGEKILSVFRATNLLSPFEKTRLQAMLRGAAADRFVRAAAHFALGEGASALHEMDRILREHDNAKWTVVTYLAFLWRPESHMFLKPEVTKDFATRVGHRFAFDYEPRLDMGVYDSLLDLARRTETELADLQPRDRIDVQSFIWVVGAYDEATDAPPG